MGGILPLGVMIDRDNPKEFGEGIVNYSMLSEIGYSKIEYPALSMAGYDTETGIIRDIGSFSGDKHIELTSLNVLASVVNGKEVGVQICYNYLKKIGESEFFAVYDRDLNLYCSSKRYLAIPTEFKCTLVFDSETNELKLYHCDASDIEDIDSGSITPCSFLFGVQSGQNLFDKKGTGLYAFNDTLQILSDFPHKEYVIPKEYKNIYIHPYSALESIVLHKDIEILVGRLNHGTTGSTRIKKVFMSRESSEKLLYHVIHLLLYRQGGFIGGSLGSMYGNEEYGKYLEYCRRNDEIFIKDKLKDVEITVY